MNIAFVINNLKVGGAETVFIRDANELSKQGYSVSFFILFGTPEDQLLVKDLGKNVTPIYIGARSVFDIIAILRIVRECKSRQVDALISTLNEANIMARWVVIVSGFRLKLFVREANDPSRKPWWQRLISLVFDSAATRVLAVTEHTREAILRDAPWRKDKVIVFRNGIAITSPTSHVTHTPVRILTVGSLSDQKDHPTLIRALMELTERGVAFEARIVGVGNDMNLLKELAAPLGSSLVFAGSLPRDAVERELREADIFVLTSRWEGCPNVILEAMAHSLPVVSTTVGGVPELVVDGSTGILTRAADTIAIADALGKLIGDPILRRSMGDAGYERAREAFSEEAHLSTLISILKNT